MIKIIYYTKWPLSILAALLALTLIVVATPITAVAYGLLWLINKLKQFTTLLNFIQIPKV
jgi:hypothetical protein